jgi:hypothetical protein
MLPRLSTLLCQAAAHNGKAGGALASAIRTLTSNTDLKAVLAEKIPAEQVRSSARPVDVPVARLRLTIAPPGRRRS